MERTGRLTSSPPAAFGPGEPVIGEGPLLVCYLDLACPVCAATWRRLRMLPLRLGFRHFPLASRRPRSPALHGAAEAAGLQRPDGFAAMVEAIYADHGRLDDPHLWAHAERLGLDRDRFEADRRSGAVATKVRGDFEAALRAGVSGAPSVLRDGVPVAGEAIETAAKSLLATAETAPERTPGRVNIAR